MSEVDWTAVGPRFEQPLRPGFPKGRKICLRHPGYTNNDNTLLYFPAYDHGSGGLHLGVALAACGIIAGNQFDGYLSASEESADQAVTQDVNQVLTGTDYYFHPHPICMSSPFTCVPKTIPLIVDSDHSTMRMQNRTLPNLPCLQRMAISTRALTSLVAGHRGQRRSHDFMFSIGPLCRR